MPRPPSDVRRGLVASTWEGAFAQAFVTLTSGIFLVKFTGRLGGGDVVLGVLAAIPFLAFSIQFATAWVFERVGEERRGITAWSLLLSRVLWVVPAAIAVGWTPPDADLVLYFSVVGASAILATVGAHGWYGWMMDLVPRAVRGRYFGRRAAVAAVVAIVVGYAGGRGLDALEAWRRGTGFAAVYVAAAGAGVLAWLAMRRLYHPTPRRAAADVPLRTLWREVWANPGHRTIFRAFAAWNAALGIAVPFWAKYMEVDLGMSTAAIVAQGTVGSLVGVALLPAWGRVIDRVGTRPVLLANAVCIAAIPFLWLFARPGFLLPVWVDAVAVGVFWTGFNLTALNVPLAAAPKRGGFVFLGVFTALNGLAMGIACIVGGVAAQALGPGRHEVLGLSLATYQWVFLASGVMRLAVLPLAWKLPDPKRRSVVFLVSVMGTAVRQRLNTGWLLLSAPWRRK
jgi:MFS family permease